MDTKPAPRITDSFAAPVCRIDARKKRSVSRLGRDSRRSLRSNLARFVDIDRRRFSTAVDRRRSPDENAECSIRRLEYMPPRGSIKRSETCHFELGNAKFALEHNHLSLSRILHTTQASNGSATPLLIKRSKGRFLYGVISVSSVVDEDGCCE